MKLTALLLLISSLQVNAFTRAQLSISVKDAPLEKVFDVIRKEAGMHVFYQQKDLAGSRKVTLQLEKVSVETVLNKALEGQQLTYAIDGKNIFIRKASAISLSTETTVRPDSLITVQGRILNDKKEFVQGATIRVKGNNRTTLSNDKGEFFLSQVPVSATLIITSVNYAVAEIRVNGRTVLDLILLVNPSTLKEVVIMNTGYQQINKERFVGSVAILDSTAYTRRPASDILSRLDGMIPGILFDKKSPDVTQLKNIQIRGLSTLNALQQSASTEPLIVVDNFPFRQDLSTLNPNDIESVTVLKDAAAASIWGAQAGNGVIVITTKKGKYNQPFNLSVLTNFTLQSKPDPWFFPQMNVSDFIDMELFLFQQGKYDPELDDQFSWPIISPVVEMLAQKRADLISDKDSVEQLKAFRQTDLRDQLSRYVYRRGFQQQYHMQLSGGNNFFNYSFAGGYNRSLPSVQHSRASDQSTLNLNSGVRIMKGLEMRIGINFSQSNNRNTPFNLPGRMVPYTSLADADGHAMAVPEQYRLAYLDTAGGGQLLDWKYRPLDELKFANNNTVTRFFQISPAIYWKVMPWLTVSLNYQYANQLEDSRFLNDLNTYSTRNLINQYTNPAETDPQLRNPVPVGGILDLMHTERKSQNLRGQIDFCHTIRDLHSFTAFLAGDISENLGTGNGSRFYGYENETGRNATNIDFVTMYPVYGGQGNQQVINGNINTPETVRRLVSMAGNFSYSYDQRYTFYLSGRKDGSNIFGVKTNNKWKPLWSAGLSWELTKEKFIDLKWLELFRMRTSFGYAGNPGNAVGYPIIFHYATRAPLTGLPRADIADVPNPYLKWEKVRTINIGFDFSLFNHRLSGSLDVFGKRSTDVLWVDPPAPSTGVNTYVSNMAELKGRGFELSLIAQPVNGQIKWQTSFNLSHAKTTVVKVHQTQTAANFFIPYGVNPSPGMMVYGIAGYKWAGLDPDNGDPMGYFDGKISKDYSSILRDSLKDQVFKGSAIPLFFGNITNTIHYKQFSLFVNITYRLNYYYRKPAIEYYNLVYYWTGNADYAQRWQKKGDEKRTTVPSFLYPVDGDRDQFYKYSEVNILRGDNIRLEDLRLQYSPAFTSKKMPFRNLQLSVSVNNLNLILWKKDRSDYDPDLTGGDRLVMPQLKNWTIGLSASF